jgi:hypothetical protein
MPLFYDNSSVFKGAVGTRIRGSDDTLDELSHPVCALTHKGSQAFPYPYVRTIPDKETLKFNRLGLKPNRFGLRSGQVRSAPSSARVAGDSIKPGVERSGTPG